MPQVDWTVDIGNILTMLGMIGAGAWAFINLKVKIAIIETKLELIYSKVISKL